MSLTKKDQRIRRSRQTRARIAVQRVARLSVYRTNLHIYASVISDDGAHVLASASTAEADIRKELSGDSKTSGKGGNVAAAALIGKRIAEKAKAAGIDKVACPTQTEIVITGADRQVVGQIAAEVRAIRPPEPYKGKGIRYVGEKVVIKETKKK